MNALDLARWQFAITTVYHFLFVPITIGMGFLVAGLQTAWYRTNKLKYLRATKFFGKLFLINFAIGVVTGIVQEFQFGMNWSSYSRFVGDIFGAHSLVYGFLAGIVSLRRFTLQQFGLHPLAHSYLHISSLQPTPGCSTPLHTHTMLKSIVLNSQALLKFLLRKLQL